MINTYGPGRRRAPIPREGLAYVRAYSATTKRESFLPVAWARATFLREIFRSGGGSVSPPVRSPSLSRPGTPRGGCHQPLGIVSSGDHRFWDSCNRIRSWPIFGPGCKFNERENTPWTIPPTERDRSRMIRREFFGGKLIKRKGVKGKRDWNNRGGVYTMVI